MINHCYLIFIYANTKDKDEQDKTRGIMILESDDKTICV